MTDYELNSSVVVDEVVKQFDPAYVITVDGRRPVDELFETVKARLTTMPLQRPPIPEAVPPDRRPGESRPSANHAYPSEWSGEEFEEEWFESESVPNEELGENEPTAEHETDAQSDFHEQIRSQSEFGTLCPVNLYNGTLVSCGKDYRLKYMGKTNDIQTV